MQYVKDNVKLTDRFNLGGLSIYATGLFASGMGPDRDIKDLPEISISGRQMMDMKITATATGMTGACLRA